MKFSYIILILGALTLPLVGCAKPAVFDSRSGLENVGASASDVARSRILEYDDDLSVVNVHIKHLEELRDSHLRQERSFMNLAGEARMDGSLLKSERAAYAAEYIYLAKRSKQAASHCNDIIQSYKADASLVHAKRNQQVVEAGRYDRTLRAKPTK
jgi:hypothetical protein